MMVKRALLLQYTPQHVKIITLCILLYTGYVVSNLIIFECLAALIECSNNLFVVLARKLAYASGNISKYLYISLFMKLKYAIYIILLIIKWLKVHKT